VPPVGSTSDWLRWLKDSNPKRVHEAKLALGGIAEGDHADAGPLIEALSANDDKLVFWALVALKRLGSRSESSIQTIRALGLEGSTPAIRQAAAMAMVAIAPSDKITSQTLRLMLKDTSPLVRREALQAMISLTNIGPEELAAISAMAADPDPNVSSGSEIALRNIAHNARESKDRG
jgi:HEAT repeat protein